MMLLMVLPPLPRHKGPTATQYASSRGWDFAQLFLKNSQRSDRRIDDQDTAIIYNAEANSHRDSTKRTTCNKTIYRAIPSYCCRECLLCPSGSHQIREPQASLAFRNRRRPLLAMLARQTHRSPAWLSLPSSARPKLRRPLPAMLAHQARRSPASQSFPSSASSKLRVRPFASVALPTLLRA